MVHKLEMEGWFDDRGARRGRRQFHARVVEQGSWSTFPRGAHVAVTCALKDGSVIMRGKGRAGDRSFLVKQGGCDAPERKRLDPFEVNITLKVSGQPVSFRLNARPSVERHHRVLLLSRKQKDRMKRALRQRTFDAPVLRQLDMPHVELNDLRTGLHELMDQTLRDLYVQQQDMESAMDSTVDEGHGGNVPQVPMPPTPAVAGDEEDMPLLDHPGHLRDMVTDLFERCAESILVWSVRVPLVPQIRARILEGIRHELLAQAFDAKGDYSEDRLAAAVWDLTGKPLEEFMTRHPESQHQHQHQHQNQT